MTAGGLWDIEPRSDVVNLSPESGGFGNFRVVAFSADSRSILTAGPKIFVWDAVTARQIKSLERAAGAEQRIVYAAMFRPDVRTVLTLEVPSESQADCEIREWDVGTGRLLSPPRRLLTDPNVPYQFNMIAFSPDGRTAFTSGFGDRTGLWDVATGHRLSPLKVDAQDPRDAFPYVGVFSHDGRRIVTVHALGLRLWDVAAGVPPKLTHSSLGDRQVSYQPVGVLTHDGKTLALVRNNVAMLFDVTTGTPVRDPSPAPGTGHKCRVQPRRYQAHHG